MADLETLKTPCLVLDANRVQRNAERVSEIALKNNVRLRPHVKTHKSVEVARIATAGHDGAVTTSTLAEVWAFAKGGFSDFTYAVPVEPGKFGEAIEIVKSGVRLNLITDDVEVPPALNEAARKAEVKMSVFLDVDCGYHRDGIEPHDEAATEIVRQIADASNLEFAGILTHAGHSYHAGSVEEIREIAGRERDVMVEFAQQLRSERINVPCVSVGSTPTINHVEHLRGVTEIRPGNYIFFDAFQATLGSCRFEDCALTVLAAVMHRNRDERKIIVDAGAIALSKDRGPVEFDPDCGYGRVLDLAGREIRTRVESVSQEHGTFHVGDGAVFERLKVGSRVRILANHSCLAAAQHTHFNVLENGKIVGEWEISRGW
jgi:D-serine deaminase-like pyridoxal phosphate-dependent protein